MRFDEFKAQFQTAPLILTRDIVSCEPPQILSNQLSRWQKQGKLVGLKRGVYLLNENDRKIEVNLNAAANQLYEPSYLSLEYALNFYGIIPEGVSDFSSITTRKTMRITNALGSFLYQRVKPAAFRGFKALGEGKSVFFIAEAEKAVVDFLYLNLSRFGNDVREVLEHSYRFQNIEELNEKRLLELTKVFENKKLTRVVRQLADWIAEERK